MLQVNLICLPVTVKKKIKKKNTSEIKFLVEKKLKSKTSLMTQCKVMPLGKA